VKIHFTKYQGTGNDFIVVDNREMKYRLQTSQIVALCDRHFGIGSDGLIMIEPPQKEGEDFYMNFYNPDGSSSFCGNGSRCAVHFASSLGIIESNCRFSAIDGPHEAYLNQSIIGVKMKNVHEIIQKGEHSFYLNTGSPHYVALVSSVEKLDLVQAALPVRHHEDFAPGGINVNFIEKLSAQDIRMRTFERGVEAETLSCGTGVTAAALVFAKMNNLHEEIRVETRGGELSVSFEVNDHNEFFNIFLKGPAKSVFSGVIDIL
jgi:diaminopimelate epimerase